MSPCDVTRRFLTRWISDWDRTAVGMADGCAVRIVRAVRATHAIRAGIWLLTTTEETHIFSFDTESRSAVNQRYRPLEPKPPSPRCEPGNSSTSCHSTSCTR